MNKITKRICICGMMAALAIVLDYISLRIGNDFKITLYAFPIILIGMLYGVAYGGLTGLVSGFISQVIFYGIQPTTFIWILAPIGWGVFSGLFYKLFKRFKLVPKIIFTVILTSLIATFINSVSMILDGIILNYPVEYVYSTLGLRILFSLLSVAIYIPLLYVIEPELERHFGDDKNEQKGN